MREVKGICVVVALFLGTKYRLYQIFAEESLAILLKRHYNITQRRNPFGGGGRRTLLDSFGAGTDEKKKPIYENVLKFPMNTEYLKLFDNIPHADRLDARLLGIIEAFPKPDLNAPLLKRQLEFETVPRYLEKDLDDMDYRVLHMPKKMRALLDGAMDADYKKYFCICTILFRITSLPLWQEYLA